jgi:putative nucleotidyltransferase with HDIG domain
MSYEAESIQATARNVVESLRNAGFTAYYAGGCVRDALLGIMPKDYDIATSAHPGDVQRLFPRTVPVGAHFGVIIVLQNGFEFQVASFRSDGVYLDGRHPKNIRYATPEEDAARRDFTINGMFLDPLKGEEGEVIDFVQGKNDLDKKIIRAIGDPETRFKEDRLRLLRGIRFAATFDFDIEQATWQALKANASEIHAVSAERIRDELIKIFTPPTRLHGFDLLDASGLMAQILPEIEALKGCEQPPQFHPEGDVFVHTRRMIELLPAECTLPLVFSVLFHDIGKPPTFSFDPEEGRIRFSGHDRIGAEMTRSIMERLRFSREEIEATVEGVANHMVFKDVQSMRVARLKRFMARPTFDDELELHRVDCASSHGMLDNFEFLKDKREEFAKEPLIPKPLITGRDVMALGWEPGPKIGEILETIQNLQLEGALPTREEALAFLGTNFAPSSQ